MNDFLQKRTDPSCFADTQLSLSHGTAVPSKPQGRYYLFLSCWQAMQGLRSNTYFAVLLCSAPTTVHPVWRNGTHIRTRRAPELTLSHYLISSNSSIRSLCCTEAARCWQKMFAAKARSSNSWLQSCLPQCKAPTHLSSKNICVEYETTLKKTYPPAFLLKRDTASAQHLKEAEPFWLKISYEPADNGTLRRLEGLP